MTVLELMIVLAIVGGLAFLMRSAVRWVTKADLVDDASHLAAVLRRTNQLAMAGGKLYRVVLDFDKHAFCVEVCEGPAAVERGKEEMVDQKAVKDAIDVARQRLSALPTQAIGADSPEAEAKLAAALAGKKVGGKVCAPANEVSGDSKGRPLAGELNAAKGIKLREVWVQHLEDSATHGLVSVYFFPTGAAEKAIVTLTDGRATFSILVHGLTGRVQLLDGELRSPDDHMMRNAEGDKERER